MRLSILCNLEIEEAASARLEERAEALLSSLSFCHVSDSSRIAEMNSPSRLVRRLSFQMGETCGHDCWSALGGPVFG